MKKTNPRFVEINAIRMIGDGWMLVTAGKTDKFNTMTACWGAMGELWFKPVSLIYVRPSRYTYEFIEKEEILTLSFFKNEYHQALNILGTKSGRDGDKVAEAGLTPYATELGSVAFQEAYMVLECKKIYSDTIKEGCFIDKAILPMCYWGESKDYHRYYVVEIVNAWIDKDKK